MDESYFQEKVDEFRYKLEEITEVTEDGSEFNFSFTNEEEAETSASSRPESVNENALKPFERTFALSVLKDAVNQLIIVNNGEKNVHHTFDRKKPCAERLKEPFRDNLFHARTLGKIKDVMEKMVLVKLRNDTSHFRKILSEACEELECNGTFEQLKYYVEQESHTENEEQKLIEDYVRNKKLLACLEKQHKDDIEEQKRKSMELDSEIYDLENEINDLKIENEIKKRLVVKWEESRHEQVRVVLDNKEKQLTEMFDEARYKRTTELELMKEIETFITNRIDSLNEQIDYWINKHETEVEQLDSQIQFCKSRIFEIKNKSEELQATYNARQIEIDQYMIERAKKQALKNFAQLQHDSAVKIQAWWRGTMVRRGLGPYKRRGKKPKKPKKAAPKGKKK